MRRGSILAMALLLASWAAATPAPASGGPSWVDFTLEDVSGEPVSLGRFIGKTPVLLVFWATWCPHCNLAVPRINRLHTDPSTRAKLQILALDFLESREKVESFARRKEVVYPVLLDRKGAVARMYQVVGIPTYVLIDKGGRVAFRGHELPDLTGFLE